MTLAHAELHQRLPELAERSLFDTSPTEAAALEAHAFEGCSICARSLVNTREISVDLALASGPDRPSTPLRARVLGAAKSALARRAFPAEMAEMGRPPSIVDPAATVARAHSKGRLEAARLAEIEHVKSALPALAELAERLLPELERTTGFAIHFATIVFEDKATAVAQRGLPDEFAGYRDISRHASFCTHTVCADAPFVVEDAAREPFFRGSKMVLRYGIRAYVGVPIRSPAGIPIGTVCALDFAPRRISAACIEVVSRCAAELTSSLAGGVLTRPLNG